MKIIFCPNISIAISITFYSSLDSFKFDKYPHGLFWIGSRYFKYHHGRYVSVLAMAFLLDFRLEIIVNLSRADHILQCKNETIENSSFEICRLCFLTLHSTTFDGFFIRSVIDGLPSVAG